MPRLTFLGAAGCVTGSKYLLEAEGKRLLVDCGLFQGPKELRQRNWERLPEEPASLDWVLLTHAHLDHSGYLPRLVRDGFRGRILANAATRKLCAILLPDAAHIQEEDAAHAVAKGYSKHTPPLPLYTQEEIEPVLRLFREIPRRGAFRVSPQFLVRSLDAGHILGSASFEISVTENGKTLVVVFSGDLGQYSQPILNDPEPPPRADFLLCESTYGDRDHPTDSPFEALAEVIQRISKRGGCTIIPAFTVGRTQTLLYTLRQLENVQRIPVLPVYVDSPMAISVTDLYRRHREDHDLEFTRESQGGDPLNPHRLHLTRTVEESKQINRVNAPCIIISASGMATGGRVLHHLAKRLPDSRSAVVLPGFQAEGTRGRALLEGAKTLRIHGEDVPVKAEVIELRQFSAHADRRQLLHWLGEQPAPPRHLFLTHGEPPAASALKSEIQGKHRWQVTLPAYRQSFELGISG